MKKKASFESYGAQYKAASHAQQNTTTTSTIINSTTPMIETPEIAEKSQNQTQDEVPHSTTSIDQQTQQNEENAQTSSESNQNISQNTKQLNFQVSDAQLYKLKESEEIRNVLKDTRLQKLIQQIDGSEDREKFLDDAIKNPDFERFVDIIFRTIQQQ